MAEKKVFITGMGGYIAGCLCRDLDRTDWCGRFYGMDVKAPLYKWELGEFRKMDINDPKLVEWVKEIKPDIMVHLAFVVDPIPDDALMHKINVDGTKNALKACAEASVPQILVASSGTAYGAWPDNPVPLRETDPLRPHPTFTYARDKSQIEEICKEFMDQRPDVIFSLIRPCIVFGPMVDNYLSALLTMWPMVKIKEYNPPFQFVHEDDVAGAILAILKSKARGPFNITPPNTMLMWEVSDFTGRLTITLPNRIVEKVMALSWKLQLPFMQAPPYVMDFMRHPWVMDPSRLTEETGYTFRYSTRETLEIMLRAKGVLE